VTDAPDDDAPSPWPAFLVCAAVISATTLDLTKINVALPAIDRALGATDAQLQLLVTGFILAFGLTLVPAGRLGDTRSRKAVLTIGLTLFGIASLLCALAPSIEAVIVGRILQGVAAGTQMPQALGLVQQLFVGRAHARAFGHVGGIIAVSTAIGPAIGGALTQADPAFGWRLMFGVNVPIAVAVLIGIRLTIPERPRSTSVPRMDIVGLLLFSVACVCTLLPFLEIDSVSAGPLRWLWLLGSAASGTAFALWERRLESSGGAPVLPSALLGLPSFRNGLLVMLAFFAGITSVFLVLAMFLQQARGASALAAGLVNIPQAVTSACGAWVGARLVLRSGRRVVAAGIALAVIGVTTLVPVVQFTPAATTPLLSALTLAVAGAGTGLAMSPNQTITVHRVPDAFAGVAASLTQVAQRVGMALGVAVATAVYFAVLGADPAPSDHTGAMVASLIAAVAMLTISLLLALFDVWTGRASPGIVLDTE